MWALDVHLIKPTYLLTLTVSPYISAAFFVVVFMPSGFRTVRVSVRRVLRFVGWYVRPDRSCYNDVS